MMSGARKCTLAGVSLLLLAGCDVLFTGGSGEMDSYVAKVLDRPGKAIDPIPEFKQTQVYIYQSGVADGKDPFAPFFEEKALEKDEVGKQLSADQREEINPQVRPPEELEGYTLDTLRMVGSLDFLGTLWGLVVDPDDIIHKVKVGNYIGSNFGKILRITEQSIELRELVKDSAGNWDERTASLSMLGDEG